MIINEIFNEYYKRKKSIEISISKMKEDLGDYSERIVLYGAGSAGIAFLNYLRDVDIFPLFFSDGDSNKWGKKCEGIEIIDYRQIIDRVGDDALVIVTINTDGERYCKSFDEALRIGGHGKVYQDLRGAGCERIIDYTYFRRCSKLFVGDRYNLPSCSDVYLMEKNEKEICDAYELLSDDRSRRVFESIVRFRLIDDTIKIPTEPQDNQYFEYEFFPRRKDEVFVDCGAYNGISLKTFLKENDFKLEKYYGIEPDESNFKKLLSYVDSLSQDIQEKTQLVRKCVFDKERDLRFYALSGPGSFISESGPQVSFGIKIDNLVKDKYATYIKMNIEGAEIQALKGAEHTIRTSIPRLAVAGYHKTQDLWKVPMIIHNYNNGYKIHLRSYMNNLSFIYYANVDR